MTDLPLTGGCNCGTVRFEVTAPLVKASYCHCRRCQRRSGAAASANAHPAEGSFRIVAGREALRAWIPEQGGEKWFCGECGSSLFGRNPAHPDPIGIRIGAFDEDPGIRPSVRQFVASAAPWEPIPDDGLSRYPEGRHAGPALAAAAGSENAALVAELHRRQGEMYAGGAAEPVAELLGEDVVWHVPGTSPIAGDHRGAEAVLAYFARRRQLADSTMVMHPGPVLAVGEAVVQLVDGSAELGGERVGWRTAGVYRVEAALVREVWLVPFDLERFDRIWS